MINIASLMICFKTKFSYDIGTIFHIIAPKNFCLNDWGQSNHVRNVQTRASRSSNDISRYFIFVFTVKGYQSFP